MCLQLMIPVTKPERLYQCGTWSWVYPPKGYLAYNAKKRSTKMKLPSARNIVTLAKTVKDLLPNNKAESSLLGIIKQQEDALHDKKAEICKLRERIWELEETLTITSDELRAAITTAGELAEERR